MDADTRQSIAWCHTAGTIDDPIDGRLGCTIDDPIDGRRHKTIDCLVMNCVHNKKADASLFISPRAAEVSVPEEDREDDEMEDEVESMSVYYAVQV